MTWPFDLLGSLRSLLFVPATDPRKLDKAWRTGVDAVIADLEDAVPEEAKAEARKRLAAQLEA